MYGTGLSIWDVHGRIRQGRICSKEKKFSQSIKYLAWLRETTLLTVIFRLTKTGERVNLSLTHMRNAVMRNSTQELEHRELLTGGKQWKERVELASEHLPQILFRE